MTQAIAKSSPKPLTRKQARNGGDSHIQKRLTSERISADLDRFEKAGGEIEVLGATRVLKKVDSPVAG